MEKFEAPIQESLLQELIELWETIPELHTNDEWQRELLGLEPSFNRILIYIVRERGRVVAMCQFYISRRMPILSEFSYPGTRPECRGRGIATELWGAAIDDMKAMGVEAIFLGTFDRIAFRLYRRLGFSKLPASLTFVQALNGLSAEEFLVDWFRDAGSVTVSSGDPGDQLPSYPLIVSPHDWQILDANAGLLSTRYSLHRTFRGLYLKCANVGDDENGARFSATMSDGKVVGMSTARLEDDGTCAVDGFVHHRYPDSWDDLILAAIGFGNSRGARAVHACVSREDIEKCQRFAALGFQEVADAPGFVLDCLQLNRSKEIEPISVPAVKMELKM
jgi:ribosomal protein S18 acetylase RimI-like enzyme